MCNFPRPSEEYERAVLTAHDRAFEAKFIEQTPFCMHEMVKRYVAEIRRSILLQEQRFLPKIWDAMIALNITGKACLRVASVHGSL